jgi:hypothetical protein
MSQITFQDDLKIWLKDLQSEKLKMSRLLMYHALEDREACPPDGVRNSQRYLMDLTFSVTASQFLFQVQFTSRSGSGNHVRQPAGDHGKTYAYFVTHSLFCLSTFSLWMQYWTLVPFGNFA